MSRFRAVPVPLMLFLAAALVAAGSAHAGPRKNLGRGITQDGDTLTVDDPTGKVQVAVDPGWEPLTDDDLGLVVLSKRDGQERTIRVLDRRGRVLGTVTAPQGWRPVATNLGVVLVPEALHAPERPHRLRFLGYDGSTRREVEVPDLSLARFRAAAGGRIVTVSRVADSFDWQVIVYDAQGAPQWRQKVTASVPPEAVLSDNGRRLIVIERGVEDTATVSVFAPDRRLKRHELDGASQLVADPTSSRVAVVGRDTVALLDAESGKLSWRRTAALDLITQGSVRFDRRAQRLLLVTADRDRDRKKARLAVRSYRLTDGKAERAEVIETPLDDMPAIVDVEVLPDGERRVTLPDRAITTAPGTPE